MHRTHRGEGVVSRSGRMWPVVVAALTVTVGSSLMLRAQNASEESTRGVNLIANPYQLVPDWPKLGTLPKGPAIGIIPDGKGGVWLLHRAEPPILHIDASGKV